MISRKDPIGFSAKEKPSGKVNAVASSAGAASETTVVGAGAVSVEGVLVGVGLVGAGVVCGVGDEVVTVVDSGEVVGTSVIFGLSVGLHVDVA